MLQMNKLRELRFTLGMSQMELAKAARLPVETISLTENGGHCLSGQERKAIESALVEAAVRLVRDVNIGILSGKLMLLGRRI